MGRGISVSNREFCQACSQMTEDGYCYCDDDYCEIRLQGLKSFCELRDRKFECLECIMRGSISRELVHFDGVTPPCEDETRGGEPAK